MAENYQCTPDTMQGTKDDPFEGLLELENTFYREGYDVGVADGKRAGLVEGRVFGLEKGFEKYARMGRLNGKAVIWAGRLPPVHATEQVCNDRKGHDHNAEDNVATAQKGLPELRETRSRSQAENVAHAILVPALADHLRVEKHIRTLYALVEPSSLSTDNTEEAVSDFNDRLKRAEGKVKIIEKIIEKITGETSREETSNMTMTKMNTNMHGMALRSRQTKSGDSSIEDISSLHARH